MKLGVCEIARIRARPVLEQRIVERPEAALFGGALRAHSGYQRFFADYDEVAIHEARLARADIFVNEPLPYPEGKIAAVNSLKVGELGYGNGRIGIAQRVGVGVCVGGAAIKRGALR